MDSLAQDLVTVVLIHPDYDRVDVPRSVLTDSGSVSDSFPSESTCTYASWPPESRQGSDAGESVRSGYSRSTSGRTPSLVTGSTVSSSLRTVSDHNHSIHPLLEEGGRIEVHPPPLEIPYPCLFWFDSCREKLDQYRWASHVSGHLEKYNVEPPKTSSCAVCGESFIVGNRRENWDRFLIHGFKHYFSNSSSSGRAWRFPPDDNLLEYLLEKRAITDDVFKLARQRAIVRTDEYWNDQKARAARATRGKYFEDRTQRHNRGENELAVVNFGDRESTMRASQQYTVQYSSQPRRHDRQARVYSVSSSEHSFSSQR